MQEWWRPERFALRRERLERRGRMLGAVRGFFMAQGFVEVDTPALQASPGLEPHLRAFATELHDPRDGRILRRYLHASPEFAMKKLLVAGMPRIWQLAHVFRDGERSATHHPEFAMLEWYRARATYRDLMDDCEALLRVVQAGVSSALSTVSPRASPPSSSWPGLTRPSVDPRDKPGNDENGLPSDELEPGLRWRGRYADARLPFPRLSVAQAFHRYAGIDLLATAPDPLRPDADLLAAQARAIGIAPHPGDDWEALFFRIFLERIEPHLGLGAPTILCDYPLSMAALARRNPADPRLAERFELYACGLELANAFGELTDAAEQRARFLADQAKKQALYGETYPIDEDFLAALECGLPPSAGIALGFDRLVMLATGAEDIEEVLWAPVR
jgi:lysyl-tRNA synthetase class 2